MHGVRRLSEDPLGCAGIWREASFEKWMAPGNADMYRARSQHQADVILVSGVRDPMKTATSVDDLAPWAVGLLDAPASPEELLRAYAWLSSH